MKSKSETMKKIKSYSLVLAGLIGLTANSQNFDGVEIKTTQVTDHIYMLQGAGGNIGVSSGEDGIFVIDDQFAPLSSKILAAIREISDADIKYLVNTHWHGDHTGGNVNMNAAGATIIAHDNVRKRLEETPKPDSTYAPKEALPVITFNDKMHIHINGEEVDVIHVANAHTDGDSQLYFTKSNVLHTGDTYVNKSYPFIDLSSGGSMDGYINAVRTAIVLINDETKVIPGHGELSNKSEYAVFFSMLINMRDSVQKAIDAGKTEEEIVADTTITATFDRLGYGNGFISSEKFRQTVYSSLKASKK
ncbi:Glyoxylase, beta-lactamase superfamily II [Flavobacteriaceae bacterium MAR_2010_188]|nr:Glyoxylase, beta-lactamase superfamily II [Flavobacteriaceae bacterium MAR_2010_188]